MAEMTPDGGGVPANSDTQVSMMLEVAKRFRIMHFLRGGDVRLI
jgi:hypothetical protein